MLLPCKQPLRCIISFNDVLPDQKSPNETCSHPLSALSHFTLSSVHTVAMATGHYDTYLIHFVSSRGTDVSRTRRGDNCLLWRTMSPTGPGGKKIKTHTHMRDSGSRLRLQGNLSICDIINQAPLMAATLLKYDLGQQEMPKPMQKRGSASLKHTDDMCS